MMNASKLKPLNHQAGLTLVELMISITIGLVILIAIGTAYVNSTSSTRQRENQSELNEPARVILRMLQHDIANAGYVDVYDFDATNRPQAASLFVPGNDALVNLYHRAPGAAPLAAPLTQFFAGLMPIFGCDGAMTDTPNGIANAVPPAVLACGTANARQNSLQIAYQAAPADLVATPNPMASLLQANGATGEGRDCNQQSLAPAGTKIAINRYFVRASATDGTNELYCSGSGNAIEQPLARGVEEFVLRYQIAQPGVPILPGSAPVAAGSAQAQYASAAAVTASALGWANVSAVEVCLISATTGTSGSVPTGTTVLQPYRPTCLRDSTGNFAADIARTAGDLRLWKRFTTVVTARNAIYSSPN